MPSKIVRTDIKRRFPRRVIEIRIRCESGVGIANEDRAELGPVVVLRWSGECGRECSTGTEAAGIVDAARKAGVAHVLLAGPEKAVADADSKPDDYLTARIDAVAALSDLLTRLGA